MGRNMVEHPLVVQLGLGRTQDEVECKARELALSKANQNKTGSSADWVLSIWTEYLSKLVVGRAVYLNQTLQRP